MALAPDLVWLFVGRVLSGVTAASIATAGAYIADVTPPERRAAGFGMIGAAFGVGFVLGPAHGRPARRGGSPPALLGGGRAELAQLPLRATSCCRSPCRPRAARASCGRRPVRWAPSRSCALDIVLLGLAVVRLPRPRRSRRAAERLRALRGLPLWLGRAGAGTVPGRGGRVDLDRLGRLVQPIVRRLGERWALLLGLGCGAVGFVVYGFAPMGAVAALAVPVQALLGGGRSRRPGPDDPARGGVRAGPASGRAVEPDRDRRARRPRTVHADLRVVHRRGGRARLARRADACSPRC